MSKRNPHFRQPAPAPVFRFGTLPDFAAWVVLSLFPLGLSGSSLEAQFQERIRSVVAVEFFIETEIDRRPNGVVGMVADETGLILLLDNSIPGWLPPSQLKDFRVFLPGNTDGVPATYLGQQPVTGWHFLRADPSIISRLKPFSHFPTAKPALGDSLWGIGLLGRDFGFQPYLLFGRLSLLQRLPQWVGFSAQELASPGSLVFDEAGRLVGWGGNALAQERVLFLENDRFNVGLQNPNATNAFVLIDEVISRLAAPPEGPESTRPTWIGVFNLQILDREVAQFLNIQDQSAIIVSDLLPDGPAARGGLLPRDIILAIDNRPIPNFQPERVALTFFEREILQRKPGEVVRLSVLRNRETIQLEVEVDSQPTLLRDAQRRYFEEIGITLREFVTFDGMARDLPVEEHEGVIANFVKPNSPAASAGVRGGDHIREIDGQPVVTYAEALAKMEAIVADPLRREFLLLVIRGTETTVLRVRK